MEEEIISHETELDNLISNAVVDNYAYSISFRVEDKLKIHKLPFTEQEICETLFALAIDRVNDDVELAMENISKDERNKYIERMILGEDINEEIFDYIDENAFPWIDAYSEGLVEGYFADKLRS